MTTWHQADWFIALSVFMAIGWLAAQAGNYRARTNRRAEQLETAAGLMKDHYAAVELLLSDPATPESARTMLCTFGKLFSDRRAAHELAAEIQQLMWEDDGTRRADSDAYDDMVKLRFHRPDLVEEFHKAVATGLVALFLRWPELSSMLDLVAAKVLSDPRREIAFARRATDLRTERHAKSKGLVAA